MRATRSAALFAGTLFALASRGFAQGIVAPGVGSWNQAMGGAATAAPLEPFGALQWNPASITELSSQVSFDALLCISETRLRSSVGANAFGPGIPPIPLSGDDRSDSGITFIPSAAMVVNGPDSDWAFGVSLLSIGGVSSNFPGSNINPILNAPPPIGLGVGPVYSRLGIMQIAPTVARRINDEWSVGFAPTITVAELQANPLMIAAPDDANGDGFATYPSATGTRQHWGGGFQLGVYYQPDDVWSLGASFKSPQWFETAHFNSTDELGRPRQLSVDLEYPMIVSLGTAFRGIERTLVTVDVRYIDYEHAQGFDDSGFAPTTAVRGLGWHSSVAVASGVRYEFNDDFSVMAGYTFTQNPIPNDVTMFNVGAPAYYEHSVSAGFTYRFSEAITWVTGYVHGFENSISGPFLRPQGAVDNTSITSSRHFDTLSSSLIIRF
jgi:long-chain fatty acid transport protein